jgi:hypothetical protein
MIDIPSYVMGRVSIRGYIKTCCAEIVTFVVRAWSTLSCVVSSVKTHKVTCPSQGQTDHHPTACERPSQDPKKN